MTVATAVRETGDAGMDTREFPGEDVVTYLDLDGDGVPDAVRTTTVTYLTAPVAGPRAHILETVEAVDEDGAVRLLSVDERFEVDRSTAIA